MSSLETHTYFTGSGFGTTAKKLLQFQLVWRTVTSNAMMSIFVFTSICFSEPSREQQMERSFESTITNDPTRAGMFLTECTCGVPEVVFRCLIPLFAISITLLLTFCHLSLQVKQFPCEHNVHHAQKRGIAFHLLLHTRDTMAHWERQLNEMLSCPQVSSVDLEETPEPPFFLPPIPKRKPGRPSKQKRLKSAFEIAQKKRSRK